MELTATAAESHKGHCHGSWDIHGQLQCEGVADLTRRADNVATLVAEVDGVLSAHGSCPAPLPGPWRWPRGKIAEETPPALAADGETEAEAAKHGAEKCRAGAAKYGAEKCRAEAQTAPAASDDPMGVPCGVCILPALLLVEVFLPFR